LCAYKEQYPDASQQNIANYFFLYGVNLSISRRCVSDILSEKRKWENETCESVKWLKGAKLKTLKMPQLSGQGKCEKLNSN
jgi:hypothetical protein